MIADKFVDLYARNSGLRDKLVAERDVVLTYALRALHDSGVSTHLAFKGGTCLRKTVFGSAGRFSEDLDFTLDSGEPEDDRSQDSAPTDRKDDGSNNVPARSTQRSDRLTLQSGRRREHLAAECRERDRR